MENKNVLSEEQEKRNKDKGMRISITIHLLILLIAFLWALPVTPKEKEKTDFIVAVEFIDFKPSSLSKLAHDDPGKKRPKTIEVKKVEKINVDKPKTNLPKHKPNIEPETIDPIISEILEEDSELEAIEEELEVEDPEPEVIPELEPSLEEEEVVEEIEEENVEESTPVESDSALENENPVNPSSIEGEEGGTGKGDSGDGAGNSSGDDGDEGMGDDGAGTGVYDGSGDGIFGRRVIYRNIKDVLTLTTQSGKVVMTVCIDRNGLPTDLSIDDETTITDRKTLKRFLTAVKKYKYEKDPSAPKVQCGKLTINMDLKDIGKFRGN